MKVLFVDHEREQAEDLSLIVEKRDGHEVSFSTNVEDAIEAAKQDNVDIIILDTVIDFDSFREKEYTGPAEITRMHRPGVQALIEIKKINPKQRVIITTTSFRQETRTYCLQLGAEAVLEKPYDPDELLRLLK